jgi:hypothetical protein
MLVAGVRELLRSGRDITRTLACEDRRDQLHLY